MASFKRLLKPGVLLQRNAVRKGVFGGDRMWLAIGGVMWLWRFTKKTLAGGEPTSRYVEELKPGERLVITHPEADQTRRRKRAG